MRFQKSLHDEELKRWVMRRLGCVPHRQNRWTLPGPERFGRQQLKQSLHASSQTSSPEPPASSESRYSTSCCFCIMSSHRQPTSLQVQANRNASESSGYPSTATEDAALLRESRQFRRDMEREAERWVDVLMESPSVDRRFLRRAVSTCASSLRSVCLIRLALDRAYISNQISTMK